MKLLIPYAWLVLVVGCGAGVSSDPGGPPPDMPPGPPPTMIPTGPDEPPPTAAIYKRGSMAPTYLLTPNAELPRFTIGGVQLQDSDFQVGVGVAATAASKLSEIAAQIGVEQGTPPPTIVQEQDDLRAQKIPFRGNPSDVKVITIGGVRKAVVPLGGDLMTPGNEVSLVTLGANPTANKVTVGIHPQRVAIHPAGLIFVCNQFSNYISVIDPLTEELLQIAGQPVEIKTDFYCTDLAFVPRSTAAPNKDEQDLYVANGWRSAVYKYSLDVVRELPSNRIVNVKLTTPPVAPAPESTPTATIKGCGRNPYRLSVSPALNNIFVANNRGGQIARLDLQTGMCASIAIKGPVADIVQVDRNRVVMATTTLDRGYPSSLEHDQGTVPTQILAQPFESMGLDGTKHVTHPGAQFDRTKATNFEDLRNGLVTMGVGFDQATYFTDDTSPEANFVVDQKILAGSLPQALVTDTAGRRLWAALSGSNQIQQFDVAATPFDLVKSAVPVSATDARPFALALDEANDELLVANWGGETLQIFDINTGLQKGASIDLGYANLTNPAGKYPATTIEKGEFLFYNTAWSNNGRKSCATCHFDELLVDGIEYANGATAPTSPHKIPANFNLATTDAYFWNGSFGNGSYAALASDFQTRSNCELIAFGYVEGIGSDPTKRVGDPNNKHTLTGAGLRASDAECQPKVIVGQVLATNFDVIVKNIGLTKAVRDQQIAIATAAIGGLTFAQAARDTDFYSVSELRQPPNPLAYLADHEQLGSDEARKLVAGKALFVSVGCARCHQPDNGRHPFTDGRSHGPVADWASRFINRYQDDPRLKTILSAAGLAPNIPAQMIAAATTNRGAPDTAINVHLAPVDYFIPGCFTRAQCLVFDDPLLAGNNVALETSRLEALVTVNLANPDRGFVPGNVTAAAQSNTPAISANWWQANFLRHGLAHNLDEAILAPGHPLLKKGDASTAAETGFAVDINGTYNVHGNTEHITADELAALTLYVQSI
jgi:DNA-binding beta-propeller fold protein YncE/mono/diheme cytochrome c family protein